MRSGPLLLREAGESDLGRLLTFRNDPDVNRFMVRNHVDPDLFRREWRAVLESRTDFSCVADLDDVPVAMGFLDLVDGFGQPGLPPRTQAVIGYVVDPEHAGRGVASDLARGLLAAAFGQLGVRRVTAACYAANLASVRVLEKAGLRREEHGVADTWHDELGWVDGYRYALLDHEWRARPQD